MKLSKRPVMKFLEKHWPAVAALVLVGMAVNAFLIGLYWVISAGLYLVAGAAMVMWVTSPRFSGDGPKKH